MKSNFRNSFLKLIGALLLISFVIIGCSSASEDRAESVANQMAANHNDADSGSDGAVGETSFLSANTIPEGNELGNVMHRKLVYTADVFMEVTDYRESERRIRAHIDNSEGYILEFTQHSSEARDGGTFKLRIPAGGFDSFMDALEQMEVIQMNSNMSAEDVTEHYVDLESRLVAKEVVETRLLEFMDQATNSEALLQFSRELAEVQEEVERLKGRIRYLDQNVAYSTITLDLFEKGSPAIALSASSALPLGERMLNALTNSSRYVWEFLKSAIVFLAGSLPILAILAVVGVPGVWLYRRRKAVVAEQVRSRLASELHEKKRENQPRKSDPANSDDAREK